VPAIAAHPGPVYLRLLRGAVPVVLDTYDYRFRWGIAQLLRDGKDALVIASGLLTMRVLEAAEALAREGIEIGVLHVPMIKPLDRATIAAEAARGARPVIVAENHSIVGGLGEAVAALLLNARIHPEAFHQIALPDEFLDAGALPTLHERYGISAEAIATRIRAWL
jgi:transketolase